MAVLFNQIKKDGHDEAWRNLLLNLNINKNGINKIIKFVNGGIENQKLWCMHVRW